MLADLVDGYGQTVETYETTRASQRMNIKNRVGDAVSDYSQIAYSVVVK
jgi:hypothetical protein